MQSDGCLSHLVLSTLPAFRLMQGLSVDCVRLSESQVEYSNCYENCASKKDIFHHLSHFHALTFDDTHCLILRTGCDKSASVCVCVCACVNHKSIQLSLDLASTP